MNWSLVLDKYPRSILDDDKALLLLALLERNGLATEDELSNSTKFDNYLLKKLLIDLQLNQFIQYGSNYVRLTEKGKNIIDRFGLVEPIVSDFIDSLGYEGKEKKDFEKVLINYRNTSFEFYQNSLCTIRIWKNLADETTQVKKSLNLLEESIGGMRFLLLRDLRKWWAHSNQRSTFLQDINKDIQLMICSTNIKIEKKPKSWDSKEVIAIIFLNMLEKENLDHDFLDSIENRYQTEPLISAFHFFQYNSAPFEWYDKYCTMLPEITKRGRIDNKELIINKFKILSERSINERRLLKTDIGSAINIYQNWIPTKNEALLKSDLLEMLMLTPDISELSSKMGIQEKSLRNLLTDIRNKCDFLLDDTYDAEDIKNK